MSHIEKATIPFGSPDRAVNETADMLIDNERPGADAEITPPMPPSGVEGDAFSEYADIVRHESERLWKKRSGLEKEERIAELERRYDDIYANALRKAEAIALLQAENPAVDATSPDLLILKDALEKDIRTLVELNPELASADELRTEILAWAEFGE